MAEHTGPSGKPPEPRDQEAPNPYRAPSIETSLGPQNALRQPTRKPAFVMVAFVLLPLLLSQATFWGGFGLCAIFARSEFDLPNVAFGGLAVCTVSGILYGILLARHIQRRSFRLDPATGQWQPATTRHGQMLLLASLNGFAFPALATGGCIAYAIGSAFGWI